MAARPIAQVHPHVLVRGDAAAGGGGSSGNSVGFPFKGALVRLSADEAIANVTVTKIPWDVAVYDTDEFWDIANPERFTVPAGVTKIKITACVLWFSTFTHDRIMMRMIKNNGAATGDILPSNDGSQNLNPCTTWTSPVLEVVAGDYFEVQVYQDQGTSQDIDAVNGASQHQTYYAIEAVETIAPSTTRRGALVHLAADATAQDYSAGAVIDFDDETNGYDTDDIHDNSTNPSRLTVPVGVTQVRLAGMVNLSAVSSANSIRLQVRKNGAFVSGLPALITDVTFTTPWSSVCSAVVDCASGDYFELWLDTESDNSITLEARTWFSMEIVVPALVAKEASRGCLVTKAADQTTADYTTDTAMAFDAEDYDTDAIHDNSTNNSRLTVPAGVTKVKLSGAVVLDFLTTNLYTQISVRKNGAARYVGAASERQDHGNSTIARMNVHTAILQVTPGDYFELYCLVLTDTSITVYDDYSWFAMEIIE